MFQKAVKTILGIVLLQFGSTALAFTLIELPVTVTITGPAILAQRVQPMAGAIKAHLLGNLRMKKSEKTTQYGGVLAANSYVDSVSDFDYMTIAGGGSGSSGGGDGSGGGDSKSLWTTPTYSSLKNNFSRTAFDGDINSFMAGFDYTQSDKYIFGVAISHERSNFNTKFNFGNENTTGYNMSPYFAILLSDTWSFDLSLGHGKFNTIQSRTLIPLPVVVEGEFWSTSDFASTNLTNVSAWGNWKLTDSLGIMAAKQKQDSYFESTGAAVTAVDSSSQSLKQWNLGGEVAYGRGDSESYVGLTYERIRNPEKIQFSTGEQPANDPDSFLLTAGWRHFGKGLTANLVFSSRLGKDQVTNNSFSTTIRIAF
jgi:hypothetical protein